MNFIPFPISVLSFVLFELVMEDMSFLEVGLGDEWQPIEVDGRVSWWILLGRVGPPFGGRF